MPFSNFSLKACCFFYMSFIFNIFVSDLFRIVSGKLWKEGIQTTFLKNYKSKDISCIELRHLLLWNKLDRKWIVRIPSEFNDKFGTSCERLAHASCDFHIKTAACCIPRYNFIVLFGVINTWSRFITLLQITCCI